MGDKHEYCKNYNRESAEIGGNIWGEEAKKCNDADEIGGDKETGWGFDERGAEDVDDDKNGGSEEEGDERLGKREVEFFDEEGAAVLREDKADDGDDEKWGKSDAEIIDFVPDEFNDRAGGCGEEVTEWEIVESGGGFGGSVMIDARAGEPTDEKADDSADNAGRKPKWGVLERFAFEKGADGDGQKKGEWRNGGGHAKNNAKNEHRNGEEIEVFFGWIFGEKIEIWNSKWESGESKRNIIMNHGEFDVKSAAEWGDGDGSETGAENKSVFNEKLGLAA